MTTDVAAILGAVLTTVRGASVCRPQVDQSADDDNLWFIRSGTGAAEVQVECGPDGALPVLVEGNGSGQRACPTTREDAVQLICAWLDASV